MQQQQLGYMGLVLLGCNRDGKTGRAFAGLNHGLQAGEHDKGNVELGIQQLPAGSDAPPSWESLSK